MITIPMTEQTSCRISATDICDPYHSCTRSRNHAQWLYAYVLLCVNESHAMCVSAPTSNEATIAKLRRMGRNLKSSDAASNRACCFLGNREINGSLSSR